MCGGRGARGRRDDAEVCAAPLSALAGPSQAPALPAPPPRSPAHAVNVLLGVVRGVVLDDPVNGWKGWREGGRGGVSRGGRRQGGGAGGGWGGVGEAAARSPPGTARESGVFAKCSAHQGCPALVRRHLCRGGCQCQPAWDVGRVDDKLGDGWASELGMVALRGRQVPGHVPCQRVHAHTSPPPPHHRPRLPPTPPLLAWQNSKKVEVRLACFCLPWMALTAGRWQGGGRKESGRAGKES